MTDGKIIDSETARAALLAGASYHRMNFRIHDEFIKSQNQSEP